MKKSRFNLLALSLISRFGRSACQKGDSESKPSFSDYPEVSEFKPSEKPTEKPTENPTEKPSSGSTNTENPSTSTSTGPTINPLEHALSADYSNVTVTSSAISDEVGDSSDIIYYYNDYQIVQGDWDGVRIYQYYHDFNGNSYQWFEKDASNTKGKSGWLNKGYDDAYVGLGGQAQLDVRKVIKKVAQYKDKVINQNGTYFIVDSAAVKDIVDTCYAWCTDVSVDTFSFLIDSTTNLFKQFAIFDENLDTDTNNAVAKLTNIGATTWDTKTLPAAPNSDNIIEFYQYKGWSGPQIHVYIKSIALSVTDESAKKDGDNYVIDIEKTLPRNRKITWDAPENVEQERWIRDYGDLEKITDDNSIATFDSGINSGIFVTGQKEGTTKVYYQWKDSSGSLHTSNKISVHVNGLPKQNLEGAVYNLSFTSVINHVVAANNAIVNNLPYGVTINKGCNVISGSGLFKGKNVRTIRSGLSDTRQEEADTRGDGVVSFDFDDQQVSGISFYYGQRYSNNIESGLQKIAIETSNDGTTWTEAADITDEIKENVSLKNLKLREKSFEPASKVRIHVYGNRIGKNYGFSTSQVAFLANEKCHKHYEADAVPVTGITIAANEQATEVKIGQTLKFGAVLAPSNATNKDIEWKVSDETLATISADGILTPIKAGTVKVSAVSKHGATEEPIVSNEITITIKEADKVNSALIGKWWNENDESIFNITATEATIEFNGHTITLPYSGKSGSYDVFGNYTGDKKTAGYLRIKKNFSYDDEADYIVNVVSEKDTLKVNIYSETDNLSKYIKATQRDLEIPGDGEAHVNKETTVSAAFRDDDYNNAAEESWKIVSKDPETVAIYDDSIEEYGSESVRNKDAKTIKGLKLGSTTLEATSKSGIKATLEVDVTPITIDTIKITIKDTTLFVGGTTQATAKITPVDADNKELTWKSSDTKVATIDANGKITALKAGTTEITATSKDQYAKESDPITLTVKDKPASGDISERAGTYIDSDETVEIKIGVDGTVSIINDYNYAQIYNDEVEFTKVSYDGNKFVGENNLYDEQITLVFNSDGTVTYKYGENDPITLTKSAA